MLNRSSTRVILISACLWLTGLAHYGESFKPDLYKLVEDLIPKKGENYEDLLANEFAHKLIATDPANENGTRWEFEELALNDHSNDEIAHADAEDIIKRSGFDLELHEVISKDGYITKLIRIVNHLVDRKQPPVVLTHGGIIDSTCWLWASSIQHQPEPWPRDFARDGPMKSSNRSLAFALANRGFDVWLGPTRGSNLNQQAHLKYRKMRSDPRDYLRYWSYNFDDLVEYELPSQLELVMKVTGAKKLSLMGFSMSGPTTLGLLSSNPKWNGRIHNLMTLAPMISVDGGGRASDMLFNHDCHYMNPHLGVLIYTKFVFSLTIRKLIVDLCLDNSVRYLLAKTFISAALGPSAKYNTFLELPVLGHLFMPTSYFTILHTCQITKAQKLIHYDHGVPLNLVHYGKVDPPPYEISNIRPANWMLITGGQDSLFPPKVADKFLEGTTRKPDIHLKVPHFNHLDLVAAFENGPLINLPIIDFLDKNQI